MDGDVSDLMMSPLSGNERDDFGKSPGQRGVLLLDRTMQRNRDSTSRLLQLPTELLADIVELLADDHAALANLALVNTECRQLARTRQFCSIRFDYGDNCRSLLEHLLKEVTERRHAGRSTSQIDSNVARKPPISTCVRRVTVASSPVWVAAYHNELYQSIFGESARSISREERKALQTQAKNGYTAYRDRLLVAIATALPNIESLAWHDRHEVNQGFFSMLRVTSLQHLKLSRVPVLTPLVLTGPLWPLRSLHLNVCTPFRRSVDSGDEDVDPYELADFVDSVLRLCAPSLDYLYLGSSGLPTFMSREVLSFPRLRTYRKSWNARIASVTLPAVLTASLTELELGECNTAQISKHMAVMEGCQPCERLETLVWSKVDGDNVDATTSFLTKHKQIQKLYIERSAHKELEQYVVPLLSSGAFNSLTSLSLSWEPVNNRVNQINQTIPPQVVKIPIESLAAIGTMTTLRQLCLEAGEFAGWRCQWLVDHDALRTCLRTLQQLRKLALSRDSYQFKDYSQVESYYVDRLPFLSAEGRERERPALDSSMCWFEAVERRKAEADEEARRGSDGTAHRKYGDPHRQVAKVGADDYDSLPQGMYRWPLWTVRAHVS